jgi:hypothetical protein
VTPEGAINMLSLPKEIKEHMANEFRFAADKMAEASDLSTKMFFYSAFFGAIHRSLNYAWNDDLALLHLAVQNSHQQMKGRLDLAIAGVEPGLGFPPNFGDVLTQFADDLASWFAAKTPDEDMFYRLLKRAAVLAYVVTGNGYYLYTKGAIKLDAEPLRLGAPSVPGRPVVRSRRAAKVTASRP